MSWWEPPCDLGTQRGGTHARTPFTPIAPLGAKATTHGGTCTRVPQVAFAWLAIPAALSTALVVFAQGRLALRIRGQVTKEVLGACVHRGTTYATSLRATKHPPHAHTAAHSLAECHGVVYSSHSPTQALTPS